MNKRYLCVAILLLFFILMTSFSIYNKSPTADESWYIGVGRYVLETKNFDIATFYMGNPPLPFYINSIPLFFYKFEKSLFQEYTTDYVVIFEKLVYSKNYPLEDILFPARFMIILTSALLGFFVYRFAKELYGIKVGFFALILFIFSPNIIAHSGLATTDLTATFAIFISTYFFWKFLNNPTKKSLAIAGITFGLAQISKFTAIYLIPIFIFFAILFKFKEKKLKLWSSLTVIFLIGFVIIWASYLFEFAPLGARVGEYHKEINNKISNLQLRNIAHYIVENIPIPAVTYFNGLFHTINHSRYGHSTFLMGEYNNWGWPHYFIVAFLIKTPIPTILFLLLSIIFFKEIRHEKILNEIFLVTPILVVFTVFSLSHVQVGLRHILPIYPFIFVFVSKLANLKFKEGIKDTIFKFITVVLILWYIASSLLIFPHYFAYFNEFIGGPDNGYKYLVDSNLDWGQDLSGLRDYLKKNKIEKVKLSYLGNQFLLDYYNISYEPLLCGEQNGLIAISATNLMMPRLDLKNPQTGTKTCHSWLLNYKPIDKIGYSIFIYNITNY